MPGELTLRIYEQSGVGQLHLQSVPVNSDGTFEVSGLSPGEFSLSLGNPFRSPGRNFTTRGDVTDFVIKVPVDVPGRLVTQDRSPLPAADIVVQATTEVRATGINRAVPRTMKSRVALNRAGGFELALFPGDNVLGVEGLPTGYVLSSVSYAGMDVMRNPLRLDAAPMSEVVITLDRANPQ